MSARLISVNVGLPRAVGWQGRTVYTGIFKSSIEGPRAVRRLGIDGDGQGDLAGHGGEHRAVLVYQVDSYAYWQHELCRSDFSHGQFGENFTIAGLPDSEVCIGDRYRIGGALLEVTQPRVTCYRIGLRMKEPQMAALLVAHGRPGFYLRVVEEGQVEAGDEIVQVSCGPERMTVFEINALLYLSDHPQSQLERALRIPALSPGWRGSFRALLAQREDGRVMTRNVGLAPEAGPPPAWSGFRTLRVTEKIRESSSVISLHLEPVDGLPLATARAGQFIVLRLRVGPAERVLLRSYSLSGPPSDRRYRVSIKREPNGVAGAYLDENVQIGQLLDVSAPRGSFTLTLSDTPVVLLSAGVGATPLLAMLHAVARDPAAREVWWLYGARNGRDHPFAHEARSLLDTLAHGHGHVRYSAPEPQDRAGVDFDALGRLGVEMLRELDVPRNADFFLCGPPAFMHDLRSGVLAWGVTTESIHTELFGPTPPMTPSVTSTVHPPPHLPVGPAGEGPLIAFARSGLSVAWSPTYGSLLELAEACDIPTRWSCRTGVCHRCETGLVAGKVAYTFEPIDAPGADNVLICCSRPDSDIVLDL